MAVEDATVTVRVVRSRGSVVLLPRGGGGWPAGPLREIAEVAAIARTFETERRRARELVRDRSLEAVRSGVSQAEVARAAGVTRQTMHELLGAVPRRELAVAESGGDVAPGVFATLAKQKVSNLRRFR